ncbi:hypothetical protein N7474_010441 [Penicillium riverlandense]|uniref:uncharacterized protein n=1 Tax=Penicillium riverlandense TaxID=1903569 RepID=UPI00254838C1|nr:uncharacterized protein N7474_010441 [Penicillium riverlandense]KAJ5806849.1 hypothetical protein N7474_010441 [Penicillium riverlandense]
MRITQCYLSILLAFMCAISTANDTVLRYKQPIPPNVQIVDTKPKFAEVQDANPGVLVYPENGGYYLKHPDSGKVVAISSDDLSTKLDQSFLSLSRKLEAEGNYEEAAVVLQDLQENVGALQKREEDTDCGFACGGMRISVKTPTSATA